MKRNFIKNSKAHVNTYQLISSTRQQIWSMTYYMNILLDLF